jgi:hypothetical protein
MVYIWTFSVSFSLPNRKGSTAQAGNPRRVNYAEYRKTRPCMHLDYLSQYNLLIQYL